LLGGNAGVMELTGSLSELLRGLASRKFSSRELLDAQLAAIARHDGETNLVCTVDGEPARAAAQRCDDERARGTGRGLLQGLPITIKDTWETSALLTTSGAPELRDYIPTRDADVVENLKAAGAIVFGKTNVPLYANDHQSHNTLFGLSRNPYDLERTPGGSSGGAAGAVASGFSALEVGSDIGGSIRLPSHCCGIAGHKPTWGVVPTRGHIPGDPGELAEADINVGGPMARSAKDLSLVLEVLISRHGFGGVPGAGLPPTTITQLRGLRVGTWFDDALAPVDDGYRHQLEQLASLLSANGAAVSPITLPGVDRKAAHDDYLHLIDAVDGSRMNDHDWNQFVTDAAARGPADQSFFTNLMRRSTASHRTWMQTNIRRHRVIAAWNELFEGVDIVLAAVAPTEAFAHQIDRPYSERTLPVNGTQRPYGDLLYWAGIVTAPLLPATVVRIGEVGTVPVGVQCIGPRWGDHSTIAVASLIEDLTGGYVAPASVVSAR
jgi:amidase